MKPPEITHDKVQQTTVQGNDVIVTVTNWANHDGYDVAVHRKDSAQMLSLTCEERDALMMAFSAFNVVKREEE